MHKTFFRIVRLLLFLPVTSSLMGQVATGTYPFGTYDTPGIDTINVGNLNVHLSIPILSKAGRGLPFNASLTYESSIYNPSTVGYGTAWVPTQQFGWNTSTGLLSGEVVYNTSTSVETYEIDGYPINCYYNQYSQWAFVDASNVYHYFPSASTTQFYYQDSYPSDGWTCPDGSSSSFTVTAADGSGYQLSISNYTAATISSPNGQFVQNPGGAATATDTNGNQLSTDGSGNFTDTTGHVVLRTTDNPPSSQIYTYYDTNGNPQQITVNYSPYTIQTAFGCSSVGEYGPTQRYLVSSIGYPDGSTYTFSYEQTPGVPGNVTGRLAGIQLPQGGWINYTYTGSNNGIECADGSAAGLTRTISSDSGSAASTLSYTRSTNSGASYTSVVDGLGNNKSYTFNAPSNLPNGPSALYYEINRTIYQGSVSTTPLISLATCYNYNGSNSPCGSQTLAIPFTQVDTYNTLDAIQMDGKTMTYDAVSGIPTGAYVYDFGGTGSRGALLRQEFWTYFSDSDPALLHEDIVRDAGNNLAGDTVYGYDESTPTSSSGVPQHIAVSGTRGNLTSASQFASASTSYTTTTAYEDTGSPLTTITPNGTTTLSYDPTFVYNTGASLPTPSSGVGISLGMGFDTSNTGLPLSSTDPNSQSTTISSYDSMLRPKQADYPDGGRMTWSYSPTMVTANQYQTSAAYAQTILQYDGYGRLSRTFSANGQSGNSYYQQDTCYDANGNVSFKSYLYQGAGPSSSKECSGAGTSYGRDVLGRVTYIAQSDGETKTITYTGRATETVDENGVTRISQIDGLGRTTIACEISSNGSMPGSGLPTGCGTDIAGTGFTTNYSYELATGTTTVTQGAQTRTFQNDWLGRPISVTEPESGTTTYGYTYNSTGLQVTRTRPRANQTNSSVTTTTTIQYDSLGRVVNISYNDGTPTKTYQYDASQISGTTFLNPKGRLVWQSVSNAQGNYSYDPMGRVVTMGYCTPSTCGTGGFAASFSYDWLGNLVTSSDASGTVASYTYSPANEVLSITSSKNDSTDPVNVLSNVQNGPFGPTNWQLGNGLLGVRQYDALGRISGNWVCQKSTLPQCVDGQRVYGTTVNWKGLRSINSNDSAMAQQASFSYDEFNRLTSAAWVANNKNPNLAVNCSPNPVSSGNTTVCTAHLTAGATGAVVFTYNNGNPWMTVNVDSSGNATTTPGFVGAPVASYTVTASYSGDSNFNPASASTVFTVNAGTSTPNIAVNCSPDPVVSGNTTVCQAHVTGGTGTVVFTYNNGNPWMTVNVDSSGNATTTPGFVGAPAASYTVTASYSGDSNFSPATASTVFTVNSSKSTPNIDVNCSPDTIVSGGTTACTAYVAGASSGSVVFTYNNGNPWMTANLGNGGTATTTPGFLGAPNGVYTVTASYSGDSNLNPASATTNINIVQGGAQNFSYVYDRWGNRWQQNASPSGPQPQLSFNTSTNQITNSGVSYDAAGNMTSDGIHTYTYDAEGNIVQVDGGSTAQYVYDAMNNRVRTVAGGLASEFLFNSLGQRISIWDGTSHAQIQGQYYWGMEPVAYYKGGSTHFQHQDWLGTERMRTSFNGTVEGTFTSLPFGDAQTTASGADGDQYHFAMLDYDPETGSEHAPFRQYSGTQGRWMSPDPFAGSYDPDNPQSFNRYVYSLNNPLSYIDPSGLDHCSISSLNGPAPMYNDYGETVDPNDPASCWAAGGQWIVDTTVVVYGGDPNSCDPSTDFYCQSLLYFEGGGGQVSTSGGGGGSDGSAPSAPNNPKAAQQQCLDSYYRSKAGKAVDFGSVLGLVPGWSPNATANVREIATLGALKYGGLKAGAKIANTYGVQQIGTINTLTSIPSSLGAGLDALFHGITRLATVASATATLTDISAHYVCWAQAYPNAAAGWQALQLP